MGVEEGGGRGREEGEFLIPHKFVVPHLVPPPPFSHQLKMYEYQQILCLHYCTCALIRAKMRI